MTVYLKEPKIGEKIASIGVDVKYMEGGYYVRASKFILENDGNKYGFLTIQCYPAVYKKISEKRKNKKTLGKMNKILEGLKENLKEYNDLESVASVAAGYIKNFI